MKQGQVGEIKVRLDRLQALISTSCIEHLEFGRDEDADRALQHRLMYVFVVYMCMRMLLYTTYNVHNI